MPIIIDLIKAKIISHDIRRQQRAQEFVPLDSVIMKQIPGTDVVAVEAERQIIRDKYASIQAEIDSAQDTDTLLNVIKTIKT